MSKFKKVISLVLCFAMLAGTVTFLGDLIVPEAKAAEGSNVKTYAELDAEYDKFIYVGIDVVEVANDEITDGYVKPGDWLEYRMTVLSDMYVGAAQPHIIYEKDFFDVRVITSTTPRDHDNYGNNDYEGNLKFADGQFMNPAHPWAPPTQPTYNTLTALPASKISTQMNNCGLDATTYSNWDIVKTAVGITSTVNNTNFPMTADAWWTSWYVRVKTGLADGETGKSFSPTEIWQNNLNQNGVMGDTRRPATVSTADTQGTFASSKILAQRVGVVKAVLLDDTYHTFTIGDGAPVEKKMVTFQYVDGTPISAVEYAEGETIVIPDNIDGLIGWADSTGKIVESIDTTMGLKALTYTAVLPTDEFNVSVNLFGGEYAEAPEGVTVEDGKLIIKAAYGEEIDLSALPLPEKEGYNGAWTPAKVKVDNIKGVNASITWSRATYTAKFYLDKEAYESGATAIKEVTFVYGNKVPFTAVNAASLKPELKLANWIDAATGEVANSETIYSENMAFYGDWTEFNGAATIWGRDYENGTWKALKVKKADAGTTIKISELKALVNEENYGMADVQYVVAGPESTYDTNKAYRTDITMVEGAQDIYLFTTIKFNITLKTPEKDENGYIIDSFTETSKAANSDMENEEALTIATPLIAEPEEKYPGYTFIGWEDEEGNVYPAGKITLDAANGTNYTLTAKYEETVYTVEFVVNYDTALKEVILAQETFTIGDTLDVSEMTLVKEVVKAEEDGDDDTTVEGGDDTTTEGGDDTTVEGGDDTTTEGGDDTTTEGGDDTTTEGGDDTTTGEGEEGDAEVPEEEEKVTYEPATLPEIGKENQEQEGGPYRNVDGYKFVGWKTGTQTDKFVDFNIEDTIELTPNKVAELTFNETIVIKGFWEGLYYKFVARYATELDAEGRPIYIDMDPIDVQTGALLDQYYAAALEKVNEKLPEGRRFSRWRLDDGSPKPSKMLAYGTTVEAYYLGAPLSVYIDFNNGTSDNPLTLKDTMSLSPLYSRYLNVGVDVENDIPENELMSVADMIRMAGVSETNSPGVNYEVVDWKIFYVENENDVWDTKNWREGISEIEGSTIAKYTLVFQTQWMAHSDFFFRVYNTNGDLRSALDKNFKKHFWYRDNPVDKEKAVPLNALPDRLIIIGFLPKFEFENGFAIRVDPLTISKAWLNPANWGALIEALIGGLSSGFGGAI